MIKKFISYSYIFSIVLLVILQYLWSSRGYGIAVSSLTYWMIFVGWVYVTINKKFKSNVTFNIAFTLFFMASLFTIINMRVVGEIIMKLSYIGWLIGAFQALIEYKKKENNPKG